MDSRQKGQVMLKQIIAALNGVQSAANKTAGELTKLSKGKDADEDAYQNAAASAYSIASLASGALKDYQ